MLSQLAVEFVKIDRAIIASALFDKSARAVMAGIVAIAKETGAYVIAEGIEDVEMLDLVCGHGQLLPQSCVRGVQGVQGYLLLRPSEVLATAYETADAKAILHEVTVRTTADALRLAAMSAVESGSRGWSHD